MAVVFDVKGGVAKKYFRSDCQYRMLLRKKIKSNNSLKFILSLMKVYLSYMITNYSIPLYNKMNIENNLFDNCRRRHTGEHPYKCDKCNWTGNHIRGASLMKLFRL